MRLLLELGLIAVIVFAGWRKPLRDHARDLLPWAEVAPSRVSTLAAGPRNAPSAPAARDTSWMWGPTNLDRQPDHKR